MNAKQQAKELIERFYQLGKNHDIDYATECAKIAVNELIKYTPSINIYPPNYQKLNSGVMEYWKEVKQEIENYE